ncbi:putative F-box protein At3g16210 [Vicia villosa]|uniref:putative F-box protein At3g16210 n=1 Tax=Vicia villosa TaxID=3911 RepID=UPI00273C64B9|nr:putative F-box protein At3g16210 [Vicia villosa]
MINYINDDIAFSILSKLSFKSFKRFECVRKSWSLLSDNPTFVNLYRRNFLSKCSYDDDTSLILHLHYPEKFYSLSGEGFANMVKLDWPDLNDELKFLSFSCVNGILCFEVPRKNKFILWNPAINELKVIPPSPFELFLSPAIRNFDAAVTFIIDPDLHGFGYDCVGNDYKLIRKTYIIPDFHTERPSERDLLLVQDKSLDPFWEIYSLKNNSWKKLDIDMPTFLGFWETLRVYMDGICHWLNLNEKYNFDRAFLISFDLSSEVFISTPIPSYVEEAWTELSVLNESIALFTHHKNIGTFDISVLGELGVEESWFKLFTVGPLPCFERLLSFEIFGVGKNGEIFFKNNDSELGWFDLNTNRINRLCFKAEEFDHRCQIVVYNKSMLSLVAISN